MMNQICENGTIRTVSRAKGNMRLSGRLVSALLTGVLLLVSVSPVFAQTGRTGMASANQARADQGSLSANMARTNQGSLSGVRATTPIQSRTTLQGMAELKNWPEAQETLLPLLEGLRALRATATEKWKAIASRNRQIQQALQAVRASLKALPEEERLEMLTQLKTELTTLHDAVVQTREDIRDIQADKQDAWVLYREALRSRDLAAAVAALENIIACKNDILTHQQLLLDTKDALLEKLNGYLSLP
jgi:DNA repair exonuclease SbcCD ATPase subunit